MTQPRPHATLIHLWADGAEIQQEYPNYPDRWIDNPNPSWHPDNNYRLKPKEPVKRKGAFGWFDTDNRGYSIKCVGTFDPDTNELLSVEIEHD
jgi:hypothetical protein